MVTFGCVAKLLSGFECCGNSWVKAVNPGWYEAREIPKTILIQKMRQVAPQTAEPPKKPRPMRPPKH
ncbi:uncharacterized protein LOC108029493 [Drosophila biarmipes]|uniref:uncharacterized protein LOC108029493 n=1 Tax=Drosophila biarmipes TaxID=125945 RepID=UPI0007E62898|nr:uncharacterized protein LOC108029493 [Drosophila biarmipes]XP_016957253.1 uncharacterized protein LOC108029493 [Drosophila biarmipes]XP_016957254.1 uncharacterized protein LOC108029493 [Drosophila biarmipes]